MSLFGNIAKNTIGQVLVARSPARAIATSLVRKGLTAAGAAIVTKGLLTPDQADAIASPLAEQVVGGAIFLASALWGAKSAKADHAALVDAAADPANRNVQFTTASVPYS